MANEESELLELTNEDVTTCNEPCVTPRNEPCVTPRKEPCVTPCKEPCVTPCKEPCVTPCKEPCVTPCKECEQEDDQDDEEDTVGEEDNNIFQKVENSTIVVVSVDGVPKFYTNTVEEADQKVDILFNRVRELDPNYRFYLESPSENKFEITRVYNMFVFRYEEIVYTIEYHHIPRVQ